MKTIAMAVLTLAYCLPAWAVPSISGLSGTVTHGGTVTVTGTGFGTKNQAPPLVWDTVSEQLVNGVNRNAYSGISNGGLINTTIWDVAETSGCVPVIYSTSRAHRHARVSAHYFRAGEKFCLRAKVPPGSQNKFYLSFYRKLKNPAMQPGGGDGSTKLLRGSSYPTGSVAGTTIVTSDSYEADHANNTDPKGWVYIGGETTWVRFEIYQDDTRKWFDVYKNGAYHQGSNSSVPGNLEQRPAADWRFTLPGKSGYEFDVPPNEWNRAEGLFPILFGYDDGHGASSGQEVDVSEIYYDNTCQRVEVSDQPVWNDAPSSTATREVQGRLTAWSNTSISLALSQGAFSALANKYLYVIDANCQASNGVLLASTPPDTEIPSTPTSLSPVSPSTTQVNLLWKASTDNVGVTGYRVEACAGYNCTNYALLGTSATTSYSHSGLAPSAKPTIYRYRVQATDAAGNLSGYSASVYFNARPTVPAFPGAAGAGAMSMGGRGGTVYRVTNLLNSGTGSFRACVQASGPRTCVFDVAGTIDITSGLAVTNPYLTIAGQTAPGDGITLMGKNSIYDVFSVRTHNVIVRNIRFRKGYNSGTTGVNGDSTNTINPDASNIVDSVIFDSCSFSWGQSRESAIWGFSDIAAQPKNITYSNSMLYETLDPHSKIALVGSNNNGGSDMTGIDYYRNLFGTFMERAPLFKGKELRFVNNIIWNWSRWGTQIGGGAQADLIGNLWKYGSWNPPVYPIEITAFPGQGTTTAPGTMSLYVVGNKGPNNQNPSADNWPTMIREVASEGSSIIGPLSTSYKRTVPLPALQYPIAALSVSEIESMLGSIGAYRRLNCQGQWVMMRDSADARIVNQYMNNTPGMLISTESAVGGYPVLSSGVVCPDTDLDGMFDAWEDANGLDKNNALDGAILHTSGYSNLERFLTPLPNNPLQSPIVRIVN